MKLVWKYSLILTAIVVGLFATIGLLLYIESETFALDTTRALYDEELQILSTVLANTTESTSYPPVRHGFYAVVDENGRILIHSDTSKIGMTVERLGMTRLFSTIKERGEGEHLYEYAGKKWIAFFKRFGDSSFIVRSVEETSVQLYSAKEAMLLAGTIAATSLGFFVLSYFISSLFLKPVRESAEETKGFVSNLATFVAESGSSAAEISEMTQSTKKEMGELDVLIQDFASAIEEGRTETEEIVKNVKSFLAETEKMTEQNLSIANFANSLTELTDSIANISDIISVLSINASIEASKENLDREGIAKIADMITDLGNQSRQLTARAKKVIREIESTISSIVLSSEKVSRELNLVNSSIESIDEVIGSFYSNMEKLTAISSNTKLAVEETTEGVSQLVEVLDEIKKQIDKLQEYIGKLKL